MNHSLPCIYRFITTHYAGQYDLLAIFYCLSTVFINTSSYLTFSIMCAYLLRKVMYKVKRINK